MSLLLTRPKIPPPLCSPSPTRMTPPLALRHLLSTSKGRKRCAWNRSLRCCWLIHEHAEDVLDRQTQAWRRIVVMRPDRPTWLEIDLSAIGHNTQLFKQLVGPDVRLLVSLKADAYGHGALRVARTVVRNGAEWLGVATVSEAEPLRRAGVDVPILVYGYIAPWQAREAVRMNLRATLYAPDLARTLSQAATDLGEQMRVHIKIDTGMARLGLRAEDIDGVVRFCEEVRSLPGLLLEGIFTHFATADSADQEYALRQYDRFERCWARSMRVACDRQSCMRPTARRR